MYLKLKFSSRFLNAPMFVMLLSIMAMILLPSTAMAAIDENNILDGILLQYKTQSALWIPTLTNIAKSLFWMLALIEFSWMGISLALRGADMQEWTGEVMRRVFFIGFFYALLTNSAEWTGAIVDSFRDAASLATGGASAPKDFSPSDIFDTGVSIAFKVAKSVSMLSPGDSVGLLLSAIVILVCFSLLTAFLMLALIEMYIVLSAGVIFLGFGGSSFTNDFAVKFLSYAVSVGAKLFIIQLLISIGEKFIVGLGTNFDKENSQILVLMGSTIVLTAVVKTIPDLIQGLISGCSFGTGMSLVAAAKTTVANAATAASTSYKGIKAVASWAAGDSSEKLGGTDNQKGDQRLGDALKNSLSQGSNNSS